MDFGIILVEGEGYYTEFKEGISGLDKEMVAFSNASGGKIYLGISDEGKITGFNLSNSKRSIITDIARNCDPPIEIIIEKRDNITVIEIPEGDNKPYNCGGVYYIRNGASSQKMKTAELIAFIQKEQRYNFDEQFDERYPADVYAKDKYKTFIRKCRISDEYDPQDVIVNLGMAVYRKSEIVLNNTGILFLGENPDRFIPHSAITCVLYKGKIKLNVLDRKDFNEDLFSNIENALTFLKRHLNLSYEITGLRRKEILQLPETALREAVINAACHRDYFFKSSNTMIEIFDDRVEISNPGNLPAGMNIEDLGKKSVTRNPLIASMLLRADYIEKLGTGISRIKEAVKNAGLPEVKFIVDSFFTVIFLFGFSSKTELDEDFNEWSEKWSDKWSDELTKNQIRILELIWKNPRITRKELSEKIGVNPSAIQKNLEKLKRIGIVKRIGPARGGYWKTLID
jgi:ATP-dependent DNA helicase RecG